MQYLLDMDGWAARFQCIDERLRDYFPAFPPRYLILDPVSQLVMSLLGGQTYGHVSKAAHRALLKRYGHWANVRDASAESVREVIQPVTYADNKAKYLIATLERISMRTGEPSLDELELMSVEVAHRLLQRLPGVGPKVAAAILNTSTLRKRSLVIDTHHLRILHRLGCVRPGTTIAQAYSQVMPLLPTEWNAAQIDTHHMRIKRLGQIRCRPHIRHCHACPLSDLCPGSGVTADTVHGQRRDDGIGKSSHSTSLGRTMLQGD